MKIKIALILVISFLLASLFFVPENTEARRGCCSWHGGVCGCRCCDGTPLSSKCAPYYPSCSDAHKTITDSCVEEFIGSTFCKDDAIYQKRKLKDCSIIDYFIKYCPNNYICKDGRCEKVEYCGDGSCNGDETCSSCSQDCDSCPSPPIGGGDFVPPITCTENWSCSDWFDCIDGIQTRTCTDLNNCGTEKNKSSEIQSCIAEIKEEICAQVITLAIAANGTCIEFPTACDVPEDWEVVGECLSAPAAANETNITGGIPTGLVMGAEPTLIAIIVGIIIIISGVSLFYWFRIKSK